MPNLTVVNVTAASTLIFGGKGSSAAPIQLVNLDPVNTVYFAYASNPAIGQAGVMPIGPFASMSFDGAVSVWAVTAPGLTAEVGVVPGGSNYSPGSLAISGPVTAEISGPVTVSSITTPVDIGTVSGSVDIASVSGDVNVNGVGGVFPVGGNTVLTAGSITVPASSIGTLTVGNCTAYTAFNLVVNGYCSSQATAGAPLQCLVEMQWYDSAAFTQILDDDSAWIWVGNSSSNLVNAYAKGPMQSSELIILFHNPSATESLTVNYSLDGTGRIFTESQWWQAAPVGGLMNAGVTMQLGAGIGPTDGTANDLLCLLNATPVAASVTVWQPLPLKAPGLSNWNFNTSVALNNAWTLNIAAGLVNGGVAAGSGAVGAYWSPGNTASTPFTTQLVLPRAPFYYVIHTTATASNVGVVGVASDI